MLILNTQGIIQWKKLNIILKLKHIHQQYLKWCTEIEYYKNGVNRIGKREILDRKEIDILKNKLNNTVSNLLKEMNFKFEDLICNSNACISADQKFESIKDLDRYDLVTVRICNKNEISKDKFAEITLGIIPEIKANMHFKKGSEIHIYYQFERQDKNYFIEFYYKDTESDIKLTKGYIAEKSTIKAY